jgi:excisionase family DNA binding protein
VKGKPDVKPLDEAVGLTGVPRRTLQRWLSSGDITAYQIKGDSKRYIDVNEVNRLRTPQPIPKPRRRKES